MILKKLINVPKINLLFLIKVILIFLFSSFVAFSTQLETKIIREIKTQLKINDFLGAKKLTEELYKKTSNLKLKEFAFLTYWVSNGYLHYHQGKFHKILEDIGGLNLYWAFFKKKHFYKDLYYEYLGDLYFLLFQYRRAIIFYIQSYKIKPTTDRLLKIILATELAYYNELIPYEDVSFIEQLLQQVNVKDLSAFQRKLYNFEKALYYLIKGNYSKAITYIPSYSTLDIPFLTKGQEYFFLGKIYEGNKNYKQAFLFYKKALEFAKHPIYKKNILLHLFIISVFLKEYKKANAYYLALAKYGGLEINQYLQIATLKIYEFKQFLKNFYWKDYYTNLVAKILWLNINNSRGIKAFGIFLHDFLNSGVLNSDLLTAWQILTPSQVKIFNVKSEKLLKFPLEKLKHLLVLYETNPFLYSFLFKDYGTLALAKYWFLMGNWPKAYYLVKKVNINVPDKMYILGVIEAYKGKPYTLELNLKFLSGKERIEALFWLGWGYLLNNRWDLTSLYWEKFIKNSQNKSRLFWESLFSTYYLASHYDIKKLPSAAIKYYKISLKLLKRTSDFKGLKRWIAFRLITLEYPEKNLKKFVDFEWLKFLKKINNLKHREE